jgi:hypothetical protein
MEENSHLIETLKEMKDIHMPTTEISIWPLAPGWWIVIVAVSLFLYFAIRYYIKFTESMEVKAKKELEKIETKFAEHQDIKKLSIDISALLKRVAIVKFGYNDIAPLHGKAWLDFLRMHFAETELDQSFSKIIAEAPYAPDEYDFSKIFDTKKEKQEHVDSVFKTTQKWIEQNL